MNVQQLIEELQTHPLDMRVIVSGHEGGYNDLDSPKPRSIRLNVHDELLAAVPAEMPYYGRHDDEDYPFGSEDGSVETALLIGYPHV